MDALEVLIEEHEIIEKAIDTLDNSVKMLKSGRKVPSEFFVKILEIFKNFADKCHHGKEETVLFPLVKYLRKDQDKIISLFLEDHGKGRIFIRGITEAVGKSDINGIIKNAEGYINLLPMHIRKENAVFPVWIKPMPDEMKEGLFERFEEIEEKVIGLGKHEEYVQNIENLKSYLE